MLDITTQIEAATLEATRARIRRRAEAWGMLDLMRPRILEPLGIPSLEHAAAHDLETIEHLLPIATLWRDTLPLTHTTARHRAADDESAATTY